MKTEIIRRDENFTGPPVSKDTFKWLVLFVVDEQGISAQIPRGPSPNESTFGRKSLLPTLWSTFENARQKIDWYSFSK